MRQFKSLKLAEKVKSNREDLAALTIQVYDIMLVVATNLKGEEEANISKSMKRSLERLSESLWSIANRMRYLKDDSNPTRLVSLAKSLLKYDSNGKIIQDCTKNLDWAVQTFHVDGQIQNTLKLEQISHNLRDVKLSVKQSSEDNRARFKLSSLPSNVIPPPPAILYGRDETVNDVANWILSAPNSSAAVLAWAQAGSGRRP